MKQTATLLFGLAISLTTNSAMAQQNARPSQNVSNTAKTAATGSRLSGVVRFSGDAAGGGFYQKADSTSYTYASPTDDKPSQTTNYQVFNGAYLLNDRQQITYDAAGRLKQVLSQVWYGTAWLNTTRQTLTYNGNGDVTADLYESWEMSTNSWRNSVLMTKTFSVSNEPQGELRQIWNLRTGTWLNSRKQTFEYDAPGYLNAQSVQQWDSVTSRWEEVSRVANYYDAGGVRTSYVNQIWSNAGTGWQALDSISLQAVNSAGMPATSTRFVWNGTSWLRHSRYTYTYTNFAHETSSYYETWNGSIFVNSRRAFKRYNADYQILSDSSETFVAGAWMVRPADEYLRYYYEPMTTLSVTGSASLANVNLYPNPAGKVLYIDFGSKQSGPATISIYSMAGVLVQRDVLPGAGKATLQLGELANGNYLLEIQSGHAVTRRQFTKAW